MAGDPRNALLDSRYPMDKIIYLNQTSITSGAGTNVTIPHGFSFIPLPMMQWSFTQDFATSYETNTGQFPSGNPGYPFSLRVTIEANATNFIIRGDGVIGPTTIYVRIFAFQPSTSNVDVNPTVSSGDNSVINYAYNYMKLISESRTALLAPRSTTTIAHNLGYYPHILAWMETSLGTIYPVDLSYPLNNPNIEVTTTALIIRNDDFLGSWYIHYRLYIDE